MLTLSALIDAGKVTPRTRLTVPGSLASQDTVIHDWFPHDKIRLTLAGVIAQSSNIGTVLAADKFDDGELRRLPVGVRPRPAHRHRRARRDARHPAGGEPVDAGRPRTGSPSASRSSVNAVQMTAAVNTLANGGVRVDPNVIEGLATTDDGQRVGTDTTTTHRVVSARAARATAHMMERVVDPEVGVAPGAQIPGYRVAGKTGTAQRVGPECQCYDGTFTVSFAGFAPGRRPAVHRLRRGPEPPQRRRRRLGRRPGVREDHGQRPAPLRGAADGGRALPAPGRVVSGADGWRPRRVPRSRPARPGR